MTDNKRVDRARQTQEIVAAALRGLGFVHAVSRAASLPGADVENVPPLAVEVKATRAVRLKEWLRQACANAGPGEVPFVVYRGEGQGPASLDDWPVVLRWADFVPLLRAGGYLPGPEYARDQPAPENPPAEG